MAVSKMGGDVRRQGARLLNQQCWNWGRDVLRAKGNLLIEAGFQKHRPPEGVVGASCYSQAEADGRRLFLWGFGLFHEAPALGGIYLGRFQFEPRWLPCGSISEQIWRTDMIPEAVVAPDSRAALEMTANVAVWMAEYEDWVLDLCGLEYRKQVLSEWTKGKDTLSPELLPEAWRGLASQLRHSLRAGSDSPEDRPPAKLAR